jgi:hypothetical protein
MHLAVSFFVVEPGLHKFRVSGEQMCIEPTGRRSMHLFMGCLLPWGVLVSSFATSRLSYAD